MKKKTKIVLIAIVSLLILSVSSFSIYVSDYYKADADAIEVMQKGSDNSTQDNLIILSPAVPSDTAFIFYPGAKVEYLAYLPILDKIRQACGITCILVKMPFNMAIFDANASSEIIEQYPEYKEWYVGGHSMGGAMASQFASKHPD